MSVDEMKSKATVEPYLIAVISSAIATIGREMTNTLLRTSRSLLLSVCKDFSCAISDRKGQLLMLPPACPVHVSNQTMVCQSIFKYGGELRPGDCFLNNVPYDDYRNTHHADYTYIVPVFYRGELIFISASRGHQADIGNGIPSTYAPNARDMYEEGALEWPCVRVQRDYKDIDEMIRIAKCRIRVPDQWYGDYLAGVGSARIGERRLIRLCEKYGLDTIKAFQDQWQNYGEERMIEEIRKFPKGTWYYETKHDPIPELTPEGITVRVKLSIDPEEVYITVDLTESDDIQPCGLNMSEATTQAAVAVAILNRVDPTVPHCEGTFRRIKLVTRKGSAVGPAVRPHCSSVATTNLADRVLQAVQCCLNQVTEVRGMAEAGANFCPADGVFSGRDRRYNDREYCNEFFNGMTCGPGVNGHDGWVTYQFTLGGGSLYWMSNELTEQAFPVIVESEELVCDSQGAGKWDSAPSAKLEIRPRFDVMYCAYANDGHINRARGAKGGQDGWASQAWKYKKEKGISSREELTQFGVVEIKSDEVMVSESAGGGGYGDPLERDPELVRHRARAGLVSIEKARNTYGVVLDNEPELYAVDYEATQELRQKMRKGRVSKKETGGN